MRSRDHNDWLLQLAFLLSIDGEGLKSAVQVRLWFCCNDFFSRAVIVVHWLPLGSWRDGRSWRRNEVILKCKWLCLVMSCRKCFILFRQLCILFGFLIRLFTCEELVIRHLFKRHHSAHFDCFKFAIQRVIPRVSSCRGDVMVSWTIRLSLHQPSLPLLLLMYPCLLLFHILLLFLYSLQVVPFNPCIPVNCSWPTCLVLGIFRLILEQFWISFKIGLDIVLSVLVILHACFWKIGRDLDVLGLNHKVWRFLSIVQTCETY